MKAPSLLLRLAARPLEIATPRRACEPGAVADAIVVMGAPLRADRLPPLAEERMRIAVELWRRGIAPVLCPVGGHCPAAERQTAAEAEGMARWMRAAGVPDEALRVDRASTSTRTNAERAAALLLPEGRRRVVVVTQPFHLRRACFWLRRAGLDPLPWRIAGSLQDRDASTAARWIAREYGAWALALATLALEDGSSILASIKGGRRRFS